MTSRSWSTSAADLLPLARLIAWNRRLSNRGRRRFSAFGDLTLDSREQIPAWENRLRAVSDPRLRSQIPLFCAPRGQRKRQPHPPLRFRIREKSNPWVWTPVGPEADQAAKST